MNLLRLIFASKRKQVRPRRQPVHRLRCLEGLERRDLLTSLGEDLVGFGGGNSSDEFWVSSSLGTELTTNYWQDVSPASSVYGFQGVGDFNGDQVDDVVTRNANGQFVVSVSDGSGAFDSSVWGDFTTVTSWTDMVIGDFNGDGRDDILGRADSDGTMWLAESTGARFQNSHWGQLLNSVVWSDFREGDFNGDGRSDIAARAPDGTWWAGVSNGTRLNNAYWGRWSTNVSWSDVRVGDFNGDGLDDIAGRADNTSWWVNRSSGNDFFFVEYWTSWSDVNWDEAIVGDFNGDNNDDIAGLASNGQWWVAESNSQQFSNQYWNAWSTAVTWDDVLRIDLNADSRDDIIGRASDGSLWSNVSDGSQFSSQFVEQLPASGVWQNTLVGDFDVSSASSGTIGLGVTQLTVDEDSGAVQIAIQRTGGSDGAATAFYQTLGVEATDGSDFNGNANGQVFFADGQTTAFATIGLIDDSQLEAAETFSVSLFRTVGAQLGVPRTAIVTIVDDESGEGLIGHWRLDETAIGQTVVDSSGEGNDGNHQNITSPNGPVTDTPDVDSANPRGLAFDGVDDFVSIGPDASLNLNGSSFTQSVWIKPEFTDNGFHGVLGYDPGSIANRYPGIWVFEQDRIHAGFGDGVNWNSFNTGNVLTTGEWNHVATTFDGTTYRTFVNGVPVTATTEFAGRTPSNTNQVDIGRVDVSFGGNIDDVRIYNRALTASEISTLIDGATVPDVPLANGEFVANNLVSGFDTPIEVEWLPDGRMLVAEQDGFVRVVNTDGSVQSSPLLDITSIVNSGTKDRGMIGFAVHPDFANNPYIYASYTYDPPEVNNNSGLGGVDGNGARVSRISRFTVNAAGTFADPNSNVVLVGNNSTYANIGSPNIRPGLNDPHSCIDVSGNPVQDCIPIDETSHTIGELEFGPDGNLYAASGDAGSFGRVDPINLRALDIDSLAGKILRFDPITGDGLTDNPFYDGNPDSNQSKVFVYGVRNPFRFALNDDANNPQIFIGDVGWTQWEELNAGTGGENFGWPAFEGGDGVSLQTGGYRDLAEVQAYYATNPDVTAPIWGRLHSAGGRAIVMGDFAGVNYASQNGNLIFTDIGDQVLQAASFDSSGNLTGVDTVSQQLGFIVDIETGPDGFLYYVDITGSVGRLDFVLP